MSSILDHIWRGSVNEDPINNSSNIWKSVKYLFIFFISPSIKDIDEF